MDASIFWPLDVALARGHEMTVEGKTWTLSPLTLNDWGDVIKAARVEAMRAYQEGTKGMDVDARQRAMDISTILYGSQAQNSLDMLHLPAVRHAMLMQSLKANHPDVTDAEVKKILEGEQESRVALEIVQRMSMGPMMPGDDKESDGDENPTVLSSDGTKPSATSLSDLASPQPKSAA